MDFKGELSELAEGARLESVYTPKGYRGFESLTLRSSSQMIKLNFKQII